MTQNDLRHDYFSSENETDLVFLTLIYYDFKERSIFYVSDSSEVILKQAHFYLHVLTVDTPRMFLYSV